MVEPLHNSVDADLPPVRLGVDRTRAWVRGLWRLGLSIILASLLIGWNVRWKLLWETDSPTFIALLSCALIGAAAAMFLAVSGLRWLAIPFWPAPLEVVLHAEGLRMNLGPFGMIRVDGRQLRIDVDRDIDPDLMDHMPDDAFVPTLRRSGTTTDLAPRIMLFTGLDAEQFTALVRPYLQRQTTENQQRDALSTTDSSEAGNEG